MTLPPCPTPAEKVTSLGKDWHRPCLRCERCSKTLTPGGHAEVRLCQPQNPALHTWGCQQGLAEMSQSILMAPLEEGRAGRSSPSAWGSAGVFGVSAARDVPSQVDMSWALGFPCAPAQVTGFPLCPAQHDGQPYCHKPCYGILFGPKGECLGAHGVGTHSWGTWAATPSAHATTQRGHLPGARQLPTHVLTLLFLAPCRCQHRSCGKLHLRQRP